MVMYGTKSLITGLHDQLMRKPLPVVYDWCKNNCFILLGLWQAWLYTQTCLAMFVIVFKTCYHNNM